MDQASAGRHYDVSFPQSSKAPVAEQLNLTRKLAGAMMLGQRHGQHEDVAAVFGALTPMWGGRTHDLRLGLAFAAALGGDLAPAHALLAEGFDDWPSPDLAMVSIAVALRCAGDDEWKCIVDRALATSVDSDARAFAQKMFDQAHSAEHW